MRRRFFLIENATAGRGRRSLTQAVIALLEDAGASVERCSGQGEQEAQRAAAAAARLGTYDAVIAAGGDGTIRHAAGAVAGTETALGIIPLGTANVLAHEIGLDRTTHDIARVLLRGPAQDIAPPLANGQVFLLMAGAGFDGRVIAALSHPVKGRVGKVAYAPATLRALGCVPDKLEVRVDGAMHRASWVVVANARHYGGRFVLAPNRSLQKSGLSAILFDAPDRLRLAACLLELATGRLAVSRHVRAHACERVEIGAELPVPVQVDGDAFGATPLVVEAGVGPRVLLIVPAGFGND